MHVVICLCASKAHVEGNPFSIEFVASRAIRVMYWCISPAGSRSEDIQHVRMAYRNKSVVPSQDPYWTRGRRTVFLHSPVLDLATYAYSVQSTWMGSDLPLFWLTADAYDPGCVHVRQRPVTLIVDSRI